MDIKESTLMRIGFWRAYENEVQAKRYYKKNHQKVIDWPSNQIDKETIRQARQIIKSYG